MILQRWCAKMQLPTFLQTLGKLNARYRAHDRVAWDRIHWELHSGCEVSMERVFPDLTTLEVDEDASLEHGIWKLKVRLLESTVPGTISIKHYHLLESP